MHTKIGGLLLCYDIWQEIFNIRAGVIHILKHPIFPKKNIDRYRMFAIALIPV
jgi:hypothetical protein